VALMTRRSTGSAVPAPPPSAEPSGFLSRIPKPRTVALAIGAGRTVLGTAFLLDPARSVRLMGVDAATANRMTWMAQMMAVRDAVIGAGTLAAAARGGGTGWLVGGAVADLVDATAIGKAVQDGRLRGAVPTLVSAGAVGLAGIALVAAAGNKRRR
jgi:hypothetical protein